MSRWSVLLMLMLFVAGCSSVDPTDPSHFNDVTVANDTASSVVLVQCDTSCSTLHDRVGLAPGATTVVSVSNEGINVGYVIEDSSGKTMGCLYMKYNTPMANLKVKISALVHCAQ